MSEAYRSVAEALNRYANFLQHPKECQTTSSEKEPLDFEKSGPDVNPGSRHANDDRKRKQETDHILYGIFQPSPSHTLQKTHEIHGALQTSAIFEFSGLDESLLINREYQSITVGPLDE
ncbi:hypothetical protein QCA50_006123 [Cerrena zonata]|uniref:Uncharacterized protein n=1 Tax=Cerrena zonata TaxID=2478898 RepID=A0AAW0GCG9_9APHY